MPRVKLFNEREVLNKAMNLFWKQGYSATSVQDLVSHLGINRASLYDTFGDKEKLFKKSLEHYRKINTEWLVQFFQSHDQVKEGLSKLFENAIDDAINDEDKKGCFVANTTTELIPGDEIIHNLIDENKVKFESLFHDYLQKGKANGQFTTDQDLKSIATLLFTLFNGIKVVSKVNPNKKELTASIDLVLSMLH